MPSVLIMSEPLKVNLLLAISQKAGWFAVLFLRALVCAGVFGAAVTDVFQLTDSVIKKRLESL